jgi:outer membrane protein
MRAARLGPGLGILALGILGLGVLPLLTPCVVAGQQLQVTLEEALERAQEVQPAIVEAEGARRTAAAADRSAWGAFLPSLSTSAAASRSNVGRVDISTGLPMPPEYSYTVGIGAGLDLFDGFRRLAQKKAASASLDAAEAGLRSRQYDVALATKQVFYGEAAREELVRVATAQLRRAEQQLQVSVDRLRAGTATRSDSLRSTVEVGTSRMALLQAEANLVVARTNLGRQIGVDGPVRALPDTVLPTPPDPVPLRESALQSAPGVAQNEAQARAARARVWAARSQYWPSLSVSYSDNRQGTGSPFSNFDEYRESFIWRFGLSWTLFNGFQREGNQVAAAVDREVAEAQAEDARRQLSAGFVAQFTALTTAYAQIEIAGTNVAAAAEDLRVQNERYQLGAATILDLLTSQSSLTEAEVSLIQARFNYLIARAELEALIGQEL